MCKVYIAGQIYPLAPLYGSNWGHKIADFAFLPYIAFIIAFTASIYDHRKQNKAVIFVSY